MNQIQQFIKNHVTVDIATFMNEVMFNPKRGYYKSQDPIGGNQDFITAPEICSAFSTLIAKYFISIIHSKFQKNDKVVIVEMGAGNGTLFCDLITTCNIISQQNKELSHSINAIEFAIIETNPVLQQKQQQKLKNYQVNWFETFDQFSQKFINHKIYFIANELFDCLPIHQFSKNNNRWQEILLNCAQENKISKILEPFDQSKHQMIENIYQKFNSQKSEQIIFEHSFAGAILMEEIASLIKKNSGMGLVIDYGYDKIPGKSTLQAIKKHKKVDIFTEDNPYQCDLTSLVNFQLLEQQAQQQNLQTSLISQAEFLKSLGIESELEKSLKQAKKEDYSDIKSAFDRLISPKQMGELFKCLIFWQ